MLSLMTKICPGRLPAQTPKIGQMIRCGASFLTIHHDPRRRPPPEPEETGRPKSVDSKVRLPVKRLAKNGGPPEQKTVKAGQIAIGNLADQRRVQLVRAIPDPVPCGAAGVGDRQPHQNLTPLHERSERALDAMCSREAVDNQLREKSAAGALTGGILPAKDRHGAAQHSVRNELENFPFR